MSSPREPTNESRPLGGGIRELVAAAQAGDREALSRLFEAHEPMMIRWARRRLGQPLRTLDETRDILHEAYEVVLRRIGGFKMEDSRSFARWMRGIITRVVLQRAGNPYIKRRRSLAPEDEGGQLDHDLTPGTRVSVQELLDLRYRFLREMDRKDRLIYRLRNRGLGSAAIADLLGLSDRAVRMRFARTDARIRLRMKQHLELASD